MARPIVRNIPFSGLSVNFSGPPGGFVWTVQVTVPKAQPYQSYLILLNGVQLSSMQGTAVYGPIQLYQGDELTITNNAGGVDAGQSGILYGQIDAEGHQPSGVFPAVSGGTVQTTGLNQIIWQGTWDSATTYAVNDLVEYDGSSYICIAVNSDTVPTNNSFWNLVAEVGGAGPTGPQGPAGPVGMNWTGAWSSTTAYAVGDGVYQNGSSYICTVANTNEPPPDTGYWSEIAAAATGVDATSIQGVAVSATAPATGQTLEYNGTEYAPAVIYPLSTPQGAVLTANVSLVNANTWYEVFTTPALAVGTWLVTFSAVVSAGIGLSELVLGTASGSFPGQNQAEFAANTSGIIICLVKITSAGTLVMNAQSTTAASAVLSNGSTLTGWTATRVA